MRQRDKKRQKKNRDNTQERKGRMTEREKNLISGRTSTKGRERNEAREAARESTDHIPKRALGDALFPYQVEGGREGGMEGRPEHQPLTPASHTRGGKA